jgi:hypothetical protein
MTEGAHPMHSLPLISCLTTTTSGPLPANQLTLPVNLMGLMFGRPHAQPLPCVHLASGNCCHSSLARATKSNLSDTAHACALWHVPLQVYTALTLPYLLAVLGVDYAQWTETR